MMDASLKDPFCHPDGQLGAGHGWPLRTEGVMYCNSCEPIGEQKLQSSACPLVSCKTGPSHSEAENWPPLQAQHFSSRDPAAPLSWISGAELESEVEEEMEPMGRGGIQV
ncbi:hypothetical protein NQZ68_027635 [Dissostichus eleginoides]|nr:hypothetical protein NQZ68_027635 [Dissostichus eleginoides]